MIPAWTDATRTLVETGTMPRPTGDRGPCLAVRILRAVDAYSAVREAVGFTWYSPAGHARLDAAASKVDDLVDRIRRLQMSSYRLGRWTTCTADGSGRVHIWESQGATYVSVDRRLVLTTSECGLFVRSRAEREEAYRARKNASRAAARADERRVAQVLAALRAGRAVEYMDGQHGGRLSVDGGQTWASCPRIERELQWTGDRLGDAYVAGYRGCFEVLHVELERCIPPREYHSTWRWREDREMEVAS